MGGYNKVETDDEGEFHDEESEYSEEEVESDEEEQQQEEREQQQEEEQQNKKDDFKDEEDGGDKSSGFSGTTIGLLVLINLLVAGAVGGIIYSAVVKEQPPPTMSPTNAPTPQATVIDDIFETSFTKNIPEDSTTYEHLLVRNGKLYTIIIQN